MQERRKFPRYESALEVKYATKGNAAIESYSVTNNISRLGVRMPMSRLIKHGEVLNLRISPTDAKEPVTAVGKVVWIRPIERQAPLQMDAGIKFLKIDPYATERLLQSSY